MEVQEAPSLWTKSTRERIPKYLDEFLVASLEQSVRKSTQALVLSLFKKGNNKEKVYLLSKIAEKIPIMSGGKISQQLLTLISEIIKLKDPTAEKQQGKIISLLTSKMTQTFMKWLQSPDFNYFTFCQNILDNQGAFKPYLYELNGCMKCFGTVENIMTSNLRGIDEIVEQTKYNGNKIQFFLKRVYSIKQFSAKMPVRQNARPFVITVSVNDGKNILVKKGPVNSLHPFQFVTNFIQLEVQGVKLGKCITCGKNDQSSLFCIPCRKVLDIQMKYKVLSGSNQKIMKQLGDTYKQLSIIRKKFRSFYQSIKQRRTVKDIPSDINEIYKTYNKVMLNLSLLNPPQQRKPSQYKQVADKWLCFSCIYYEIQNFLVFWDNQYLLSQLYINNKDLIVQVHDFLLGIYAEKQLPISVSTKIERILGTIKFHIYQNSKNIESIDLTKDSNSGNTFNIFKHFFLKLKETDNLQSQKLILNFAKNNKLKQEQITSLALLCIMNKEDTNLFTQSNITSSQQFKAIEKAETQKSKDIFEKLKFDPSSVLNRSINNEVILLLKYLPEQLISISNIQLIDQSLIPYITSKIPKISKQLPIVFSPHPILPLNHFESFPSIAQKLNPEECSQLLQQIFKFKPLWNFNLYATLQACNTLLQKQDRQKQFLIYLKGLSAVEDNYFLFKVQTFLIPKRKHLTIKIQLPQKDIKNHYKKYNQELQYPVVKQRQIKTQNLPGETMKEVYDWIMEQMRQKMPFDLISEGKIIDDLNAPIQMIHKKLYPKVDGKPSVDTMRIIYRIRGFFEDQGSQDKLPPVGDEQLQESLNFAPLLTKSLNSDNSTCGLDTLFKIFKNARHKPQLIPIRKMILRIFSIVFKSQVVRIKTIERNYVDILIRQTLIYLASKDQELVKDKEILLQLVSKLIDQASSYMEINTRKPSIGERKGSEMMDIEDDRAFQTASKNVNLLLQKISEADSTGKVKDAASLIKLLPFSSKDIYQISQKLYNYFTPLEVYESKNRDKIQKLLIFMEAIPRGYSFFKNFCFQRKFTVQVLNSFSAIIPNLQRITDEVIVQNQPKLSLDLRILKSSVQSCEPLQKEILVRDLAPLIHKLSVTSTQCSRVVSFADELMKNLTNKLFVVSQLAEQSETLIKIYTQQKRKKAQASRAARMELQRKKRDLAAQNAFKNVTSTVQSDSQKFEHLKCVVCKSGYESSNSILGVYIFLNRCQILSIDKWWADPKRLNSGTGVTFFTIIHFECHRNAQVYDNQNKINQWEGAQKRNADSKCNSWIPIKGPNNTDEELERAARKYLDYNKGSGFWVPLNDLRGLLWKLGNQENLSKDSKGSASSNARLVCVLMALTCGFAKKAQNFKQTMQGFWTLKGKDIQSLQILLLFMTVSVFNVPNKDFESFKKLVYEKILKFASKQQNKFNIGRPFLIILGIIKEIYRLVHSNVDQNKDLPFAIEEYISKNLNVIEKFQEIADYYKSVLIKKSSFQQFEAQFSK